MKITRNTNSRILAIDGHDGAGKTTLAKLLSQELGAIYVRPFGGDTGVSLIDFAEKKEYENVSRTGIEAINTIFDQYKDEILIFDRHWMTVFTLLPEEYWEDWLPVPKTTLCYSDIETTLTRLTGRSEKEYDRSYHEYYLEKYLSLGKKFDANILRTDDNSIEKCLEMLVSWATNE